MDIYHNNFKVLEKNSNNNVELILSKNEVSYLFVPIEDIRKERKNSTYQKKTFKIFGGDACWVEAKHN